MKVTDIKWDCDDDTVILPSEVEIPDDLDDIDEISDWLTDEYPWCAKSFSLPIKDDGKD